MSLLEKGHLLHTFVGYNTIHTCNKHLLLYNTSFHLKLYLILVNICRKPRKPDQLKPPDLWIHHDHMELKNVEKLPGSARRAESLLSPSSRDSYTDLDEKIPLQCDTSSLDKKNFLSSYLVSGGHPMDGRNTLTGRSIKSQLLSDTSGHLSDGTKTYETTASGSSAASSQNNLHTMAQYRWVWERDSQS